MEKTIPQTALLNACQAADACGISRTTFWRLQRAGVIQPAFAIGRLKRFDPAAIRAALTADGAAEQYERASAAAK